MDYLARTLARTFDPHRRGVGSGDHMALGYRATRGRMLPATVDLVVLMRRALYPTPGPWMYCGAAEASTGTVVNYPGFTHDAKQGYQYAALRAHPNGFGSALCEPIRVDFDAGGAMITPALPAWPIDVSATAIDGGKVRVEWMYSTYGQGLSPTDFQVFEGADAGSVDYDTPLVDSITGLNHTLFDAQVMAFSFTTAAFGDGTSHVFAVRARNSSGVPELNTNVTNAVTARATGPAAATIRHIHQRRTG